MKTRKLIFLDFDERFGFFIEQSRYDFMLRFQQARATVSNWGEFLGWFSADEIEFLMCFIKGNPVQPKPDDGVGSVEGDVFFGFDDDFPMVQLADETYALLAPLALDPVGELEIFTTEYGVPIGMYEKSRITEVAVQLKKHGFSVET